MTGRSLACTLIGHVILNTSEQQHDPDRAAPLIKDIDQGRLGGGHIHTHITPPPPPLGPTCAQQGHQQQGKATRDPLVAPKRTHDGDGGSEWAASWAKSATNFSLQQLTSVSVSPKVVVVVPPLSKKNNNK